MQDPLRRNYLIAQQELNRISMINRQGQVLFEKDYITSNEMDIQYYRFGRGVEIVAVTDPLQGLTYLYDGTGAFINFQPLSSSNKIAMTITRIRRKTAPTKAPSTILDCVPVQSAKNPA